MTDLAAHTVKAFDADLANLLRLVAELRDLVEKELKDAIEAVIRGDGEFAKATIELDRANNALHRQIEDQAVTLIARRQPVAYDLRLIVAVWETAIELNRVGNLARGIASHTAETGKDHALREQMKSLRRIGRAALRRLREAVDSLMDGDVEKADRLWRSDHEIDSIYTSLCRELLTYIMADTTSNPAAIGLLFCAKSIESIGDNIANITDAVHYMVHGQRLENIATAAVPAA
jgi:phosphate transport system protein